MDPTTSDVSSNDCVSLGDLQRLIRDMYFEKDVARGIEGTFMWLMEEVGEVARIMARKYGEQSFKESDNDVDLADEMADVLFVLICLANQTGVDLQTAFKQNIAKKTSRDKTRHSNNPKLTVEN